MNFDFEISIVFNRIIYSAKRQGFSFQNSPKTLDPSYKMDLYFWDCVFETVLENSLISELPYLFGYKTTCV